MIARMFLKYKFTILLSLIIIFLSLLPSRNIPENNLTKWDGFDKLIHFLMYAFLSLVVFYETRCSDLCLMRYFILALGILVFSIIIELLQKFIVSIERSSDILDFTANLFGIILSLSIFLILSYIKS